jgi:hypothetical protein
MVWHHEFQATSLFCFYLQECRLSLFHDTGSLVEFHDLTFAMFVLYSMLLMSPAIQNLNKSYLWMTTPSIMPLTPSSRLSSTTLVAIWTSGRLALSVHPVYALIHDSMGLMEFAKTYGAIHWHHLLSCALPGSLQDPIDSQGLARAASTA